MSTHGLHGTITYMRWKSMRARTSDRGRSRNKNYANVMCCERWSSFEAFLADMGECPPGHSIDRYPNTSGNYEPGNCRWATDQQQSANRRHCIQITRDGRTMTASEWAVELGLKPSTVIERIRRGFSHEEAISGAKSLHKGRKPTETLTFLGRTQTLVEWAREIGISPNALRQRVGRLGWPLERALTKTFPPRRNNP